MSALLCTSATVRVTTTTELQRALAAAQPGHEILIAAGAYAGFHAKNVRGGADRPVIVRGENIAAPPTFTGTVQLSDAAHLTLEHIVIRGAPIGGLNIDDGGSYETPSHHITLRNVNVTHCGGAGNHDGIKLSGVDDFVIESCRVDRWGRNGSAIDVVGCHRGRIEACSFHDLERNGAANGVQTKGGSRDITIRRCRFEHAGQRAVNIGGSTGLPYFRPKSEGPTQYEAKDITVEDCTFIGSMAPIAFVGVDGAIVRRNTFYLPAKWFMRILQETNAPEFVPCRNGAFIENLIVYQRSEVSTPVNVGAGTAPETFRFERNYWFAMDDPARSAPVLPTAEAKPAGGDDPQLRDAARGDLTVREGSPARGYGAPR